MSDVLRRLLVPEPGLPPPLHDLFTHCVSFSLAPVLGSVLQKARFWQRFATELLSERQVTILNKLLDGIEGKLTTSKWAKMAKCSQDTAYRDILELVQRGALQKEAGGGVAM